MSHDADMAERRERILGELSELGLALARDLQESALAAGTPDEKAALANAFHRISRSVRQSLALEARLMRDRKRDEAEDAALAQRQAKARVDRRRDQVRAAVERLIWTEHETDEAEPLIDELDDLLAEESLHDGFTADPVEVHIARICAEFGLTGPPPPPPDLSHGADPPWRDSA